MFRKKTFWSLFFHHFMAVFGRGQEQEVLKITRCTPAAYQWAKVYPGLSGCGVLYFVLYFGQYDPIDFYHYLIKFEFLSFIVASESQILVSLIEVFCPNNEGAKERKKKYSELRAFRTLHLSFQKTSISGLNFPISLKLCMEVRLKCVALSALFCVIYAADVTQSIRLF